MSQPSDSDVKDLMAKLTTAFSGFYDFPKTGEGLEFFTKRLLQIVWCIPTSQIPKLKGNPHGRIGDVRDDDWLIGEVFERFERFPPLIAWRRLYCENLPPRDGREVEDMEV